MSKRTKPRGWPLALAAVLGAALVATGPAPGALAQSKPALTVGIPNDLTTIDPHRISSGSDDNLFGNVLEPLYGHDIDGTLTPLLAESVDISADGKTYDFMLKQGVKFHTGDEFTAEDVRYSWQRGIDPNIVNPRSVVVLKNIEDIEVVDKYHARMKLKDADAATLHNMEGTFYILSRKYLTEGEGMDEAKRVPIGTGPFKYVGRQVKEWIRFAAFDDHWGRVPAVGDVTMRIVPDSQARFALVQTGEADIVSSVPAFIASREGGADDYRIIQGPGFVNIFMHIHNRSANADLKKAAVRKAFNMAIDKPALYKAITQGYATLHDGAPCGPAIVGCDPVPPSYGYDPAAARKMLEDANFDFSKTIGIISPASGRIPQSKEAAEAIAYSLNQIGVKTDLIIKEYGAWLAEDQQGKQPKNPATDLVISQFPDYNVNPIARLRRSIMTDGCCSWFSDPDLDAMILKMNTIVDQQERTDYAKTIWAKVHDLAPSIFLWSFDTIYGARSNIDWKPQFGSNNFVLWNAVKK